MPLTQDEHFNNKYRVIERKTGREVKGAFILLPDKDPAARAAMASYAEATNSYKTSRWLRAWLSRIRREELLRRRTDRSMFRASYDRD